MNLNGKIIFTCELDEIGISTKIDIELSGEIVLDKLKKTLLLSMIDAVNRIEDLIIEDNIKKN